MRVVVKLVQGQEKVFLMSQMSKTEILFKKRFSMVKKLFLFNPVSTREYFPSRVVGEKDPGFFKELSYPCDPVADAFVWE